MGRLDLPPDENIDLEELEGFAKEFKQRRIKLGKINSVMVCIVQNSKPRLHYLFCSDNFFDSLVCHYFKSCYTG